MSKPTTPVGERAPQVGQVWAWRDESEDQLRITRLVEAGWMGTRLNPEPWEKPDQEWLLHINQIEAGRYVRIS